MPVVIVTLYLWKLTQRGSLHGTSAYGFQGAHASRLQTVSGTCLCFPTSTCTFGNPHISTTVQQVGGVMPCML